MPSRVVTKRRVKRRQQRLVSKNVKRKARTVRTLRKHRNSVKKVMRGGIMKPFNFPETSNGSYGSSSVYDNVDDDNRGSIMDMLQMAAPEFLF